MRILDFVSESGNELQTTWCAFELVDRFQYALVLREEVFMGCCVGLRSGFTQWVLNFAARLGEVSSGVAGEEASMSSSGGQVHASGIVLQHYAEPDKVTGLCLPSWRVTSSSIVYSPNLASGTATTVSLH